MSNRISREGQQWLVDVVSSNGAIETDAVSPKTSTVLRDAGVSMTQLKSAAGADGRIDSADEALKLVSLVEAHTRDPVERNELRAALLTEFRTHSVKSLGLADALVLSGEDENFFDPSRSR